MDVPELDRPILIAAYKRTSIRGQRDIPGMASLVLYGTQTLSALYIPNSYLFVIANDEESAIRVEHDRSCYASSMSMQDLNTLPGLNIPQPYIVIITSTGEQLSIRTKRNRRAGYMLIPDRPYLLP